MADQSDEKICPYVIIPKSSHLMLIGIPAQKASVAAGFKDVLEIVRNLSGAPGGGIAIGYALVPMPGLADLKDFLLGPTVAVSWEVTDTGLIEQYRQTVEAFQSKAVQTTGRVLLPGSDDLARFSGGKTWKR